MAELLARPNVSYDKLLKSKALKHIELSECVINQVEIQIKYSGYIERQLKEVERQKAYVNQAIPTDVDYNNVTGLSVEVRQRLLEHRPKTVGQAARISGMTPAAISLLLIYLKKINTKAKASH